MLYFGFKEAQMTQRGFSSARHAIVFTLIFYTLVISLVSHALASSGQSQDFPELLLTQEGFLAIDSPKGWIRADGPGLAFFVHKNADPKAAVVWIYISSAQIGPGEEVKTLADYIESDINGFKHRFKKGVVQKEAALDLPKVGTQASVWTFTSGENSNSYEQVVYVGDRNRVLMLTLSAKKKDAFAKALKEFRQFAKSYRGNISPDAAPAN